jgi:hypothetical protein
MVEILAPVLLHDEQAVLTAVELALEAGAPSKQTVLNFAAGRLDGVRYDGTPRWVATGNRAG